MRDIALALIVSCQVVGSAGAETLRLHPLQEFQFSKDIGHGPYQVDASKEDLVVLATHVSLRRLVVFNRGDGTVRWHYPGKAWQVHFYGAWIIVDDVSAGIVALERRTGRRLWSVPAVQLEGRHRVLRNRLVRVYGAYVGILDLTTGKVVTRSKDLITIDRYDVGVNRQLRFTGHEARAWPGADRHGRVLGVFRLLDQASSRFFLWTLSGAIFAVTEFDQALQPTRRVIRWSLPQSRNRDDLFESTPSPNKLAHRLLLVEGKLLAFEHYNVYRWSWGRGTNRLVALDLAQMKIAGERWFRREHKQPHREPRFFAQAIFGRTNTGHPQESPGSYRLLSLAQVVRPQKNKPWDAGLDLRSAWTDLRRLGSERFLLYRYESKQVQPKVYRRTVTLRAWQARADVYSSEQVLNLGDRVTLELYPMAGNDLPVIITGESDQRLPVLRLYRVEVQ
jgi:hypothetical protein